MSKFSLYLLLTDRPQEFTNDFEITKLEDKINAKERQQQEMLSKIHLEQFTLKKRKVFRNVA